MKQKNGTRAGKFQENDASRINASVEFTEKYKRDMRVSSLPRAVPGGSVLFGFSVSVWPKNSLGYVDILEGDHLLEVAGEKRIEVVNKMVDVDAGDVVSIALFNGGWYLISRMCECC